MFNQEYTTIKVFKPEEIIPLISKNKKKIKLGGFLVSRNTEKLFCFKKFGLSCKKCGKSGNEFHLVEIPKHQIQLYQHVKYCLQLYHVNGEEKELMTLDHIIPISKGGSTKGSHNFQTMCSSCNSKKGNILDV